MSLIGETVKVYWNFNRKCWSIQHKGKVVIHALQFSLGNCNFKVSEAGRARVLKTRRKNVHAFAVGELLSFTGNILKLNEFRYYPPTIRTSDRQLVTYNPYKCSYFHLKPSNSKQELIKVENTSVCYGEISNDSNLDPSCSGYLRYNMPELWITSPT